MSWKLHSIWISKPEKGEWGEQEEGGSSPGPIQPLPSFPTSCCREADCRVRTQGVMQRKEPCWTAAQARFKNKHFAVRIKANSAFMYITSYMFRRKRFFWLLEEREAEGRASKRGGPSFPTQIPLIRWSDPKVCAVPFNMCVCWTYMLSFCEHKVHLGLRFLALVTFNLRLRGWRDYFPFPLCFKFTVISDDSERNGVTPATQIYPVIWWHESSWSL